MAENLPGFEEASRALFVGNREEFEASIAGWPEDVRTRAVEDSPASSKDASASAWRPWGRAALGDFIERVPVLINRLPEPMLLVGNGDDHLVRMPDVLAALRLAPEVAGIVRFKLESPATHSLIGDDHRG
jgi:hypothetical protein